MSTKFTFRALALSGVLLAAGVPAFAADMAPNAAAPNALVATDSKTPAAPVINKDGINKDGVAKDKASKDSVSKDKAAVTGTTGKVDDKSATDQKTPKDKQSKTKSHKTTLQTAQHQPEKSTVPATGASTTVQH